MSARTLRLVAPGLALVAALSLGACSSGRSSTSTATTAPAVATTVAGPATPSTAVAAGGATSDQALDQQIQGVSNSLNQVSGDLSSADKAIANGG